MREHPHGRHRRRPPGFGDLHSMARLTAIRPITLRDWSSRVARKGCPKRRRAIRCWPAARHAPLALAPWGFKSVPGASSRVLRAFMAAISLANQAAGGVSARQGTFGTAAGPRSISALHRREQCGGMGSIGLGHAICTWATVSGHGKTSPGRRLPLMAGDWSGDPSPYCQRFFGMWARSALVLACAADDSCHGLGGVCLQGPGARVAGEGDLARTQVADHIRLGDGTRHGDATASAAPSLPFQGFSLVRRS